MFTKESLYINAIKYGTQLKISYKKLHNNDIIETSTSTFISKDDILARDITDKLNAHASQVDDTYISTLLLNDEVKLIKKDALKPKDYVLTSLNNDYNIAISKNNLFETKNYFEKCGIDYIFSAYHILNLHIEQNPCNNNLVVLLFNNQFFCLVLNDKGEIVFNKKKQLTPFEEIKNTEFYENELLGQKLFDEIYTLELRELIKGSIEEFYATSKNVFIEKISILYNIKLVLDEDIDKMKDDLMIDITYHPISVDEELFELSKDTHIHKSFIKPRKKPNNRFKNFTLFFVTILLILSMGYLFLPIKEFINNMDKEKSSLVKVPEKKVLLPNHKLRNQLIEKQVLFSLGLIPYNVVLNEMYLDDDSLKMDINLLSKDTFIKVLQPELLKSYKNAEINFRETKTPVLEAVINAKEKIKSKTLEDKNSSIFVDYKDSYIENEFMPIIRVTEQMKILFPKDSIVTFKSSSKSDVFTFNYLVNVLVKTPLEFFNIIDRLNNELYSVNISYPISFIKTEAGIEIEFIVQFHQLK